MGRPTKPGLDYFRHDVGLMSDPKLITPRRKYGAAAIVVYLQLLVMAYRDKGYYVDYGDESRDDVIWSIKSEVLSGKYEPDADKIAEMIDCLVACRLFIHDLYQRGFITSHRIQEHYYFATSGRTDPEVRWDIWLLSETEMRAISTRSVLLQKFISHAENNSFTSEKPTFPDDESTHSKVNEKQKDIESNSTLVGEVEQVLKEPLNKANRSAIQKMQTLGMTDHVILSTAEYAVKRAKDRRAPYFMTVLRERMKQGVLTAADLEATQGKAPPRRQPPDDGYLHPGSAAYDEEWARRVREHQKERRARRLAAEQGMNQEEDNA